MARTPILITPETAAALLEARKDYDAAVAVAEAAMIAAVSDAVERGEVTIQAAGPLVGIPRDRLSERVKAHRATNSK
ncbi:MAG: hypothetical protein Q7T55_19880 [Solirubrobacteraceae bacterium]|nr:hypothetical protein [Solirubrobacteraceae bacterium]